MNTKYSQYSKFKAIATIYFKAQALCDIKNIGSIVNAFIIAIKIQFRQVKKKLNKLG